MVKLRTPEDKKADEFINQMADKPYGNTEEDERLERITISVRGSVYDKLDDIVRKRKRAKQSNRTMSALVIEAVEFYLSQTK